MNDTAHRDGLDVRPTTREWVIRHGILRTAMKLAATAGELHARLSIDPAVREDPYPVYDEVRSRGPVVRGLLTTMVVSHPAVSSVLRDDRFRVGFDDPGVPAIVRRSLSRGPRRVVGPIDPPSMLVVNPPEHTRYRRKVSRVFSARAVAALEAGIRTNTAALLDDLDEDARAGRPVDLVSRYADLLPVTVILTILGIDTSMRDRFLEWGNSAAMSLDLGLSRADYLRCEDGVARLNAWLYGHIDRLRAEPGDDLLSQLVHDDDSDALTDREAMATVNLIIGAGFETTVNLISSGIRCLAMHPEQAALLRAEPSRWGNAIEEVLRYEAPVQETVRCAAEDVVVEGHRIRRGDFVGVVLGAANRDPEVFHDPHRFDVTRENARDHVSFSVGIHHCLGAALGRLEGRVALQSLFERFPAVRPAGPVEWRTTRTLRGLARLPVLLGPPASGTEDAPVARRADRRAVNR